MSYPQLLADAASTGSQTSAPISLQTVLLIIIAGALLYLAKNLAKLNNRVTSVEAVHEAATRAPFASQRLAAPAPSAVEPEVVAAISAAIHTTLRAHHRIISIGEINAHHQAWSAEGRRQVFSSHKVR